MRLFGKIKKPDGGFMRISANLFLLLHFFKHNPGERLAFQVETADFTVFHCNVFAIPFMGLRLLIRVQVVIVPMFFFILRFFVSAY